jgi:enoyl-CoA hydratase
MGNVLVEQIPLNTADQYLGLITLNRPNEMNPLDSALVKDLQVALRTLSDKKTIRVIAITGAGRAFSAGGDMKGYLTLYRDPEAFHAFMNDLHSTFGFIAACEQPVVALINGYCVAGGLELVLACDFAYAAESAKIGDGHANFGQVGGAGSNVRLPRLILPSRARELLFAGRLLNANDALEWGLVNRVVPDDRLIETGIEFANIVATKSPIGTSLMKEICNFCLNMPLEEALQLEMRKVHHYAVTSHDSYEGLLAFSEKRQPKFQGK